MFGSVIIDKLEGQPQAGGNEEVVAAGVRLKTQYAHSCRRKGVSSDREERMTRFRRDVASRRVLRIGQARNQSFR